MNLRNLKTFSVAAHHLNFTKAAEELNFAQPTVTAQIHALEQELNQKLFMRVGKKTYLTPAGKMLKEQVTRLLDIVEEIDTSFKQLSQPQGELIIAAPEFHCSYHLPYIISDYLNEYPEVTLKVISCNSNEVIEGIQSDQFDMGVITGICEHHAVENILLDEEELILVTSPLLYEKYTLEEMVGLFPFIRFRIEGNYRDYLDRFLQEAKLTPKKIVEFSSEEAIKNTILHGMGVALLTRSHVESEINNGKLVPYPLKIKPIMVPTSLILLKEKLQQFTIQSLMEIMRSTWNCRG